MAVTSENDGDVGATAEADGDEEVLEDGFGHREEVVLDIDDQQCGGFWVGVSMPNLVLVVRGGN